MTCSPARLAANRANALLSTGPRTEAGKAASRGNALTHGLSGSGVVLPATDVEAVERLKGAFERELGPRGEVALGLVHRAAVLTARLDRCGRQEVAALADRINRAEADFDDGRLDEVDLLMAGLLDAPGPALRRLGRMPEGVDRLVEAWLGLRSDLDGPRPSWTPVHRAMAEALLGRREGDFGASPVRALSEAIRGEDGSGEGVEGRERARAGLVALIDEAVARLREHREGLDLGAIAQSRAGAPDRALFDFSSDAALARRYEAATERGLFRTLQALTAIEGRQGRPEPEPASPPASALRESTESARRQLARAEAEVKAYQEDRAALGSFRAEPPAPQPAPSDPAERARRPDPRQLKRALKAERRENPGESRESGRAEVPASARAR